MDIDGNKRQMTYHDLILDFLKDSQPYRSDANLELAPRAWGAHALRYLAVTCTSDTVAQVLWGRWKKHLPGGYRKGKKIAFAVGWYWTDSFGTLRIKKKLYHQLNKKGVLHEPGWDEYYTAEKDDMCYTVRRIPRGNTKTYVLEEVLRYQGEK